jgi:hypothetical protein
MPFSCHTAFRVPKIERGQCQVFRLDLSAKSEKQERPRTDSQFVCRDECNLIPTSQVVVNFCATRRVQWKSGQRLKTVPELRKACQVHVWIGQRRLGGRAIGEIARFGYQLAKQWLRLETLCQSKPSGFFVYSGSFACLWACAGRSRLRQLCIRRCL